MTATTTNPASATLRDLLRPDILRDPFPYLAELRRRVPVAWDETLGSWVLTRHADCLAVLRDPARFASDWRRVGDDLPPALVSVQTLDPPAHTVLRHFLAAAFRAQDLVRIERLTAEQARRRLDELARLDSFDFVSEVAAPLALGAITTFLGVKPPDRPWFEAVSDAIATGMDAGLAPEVLEVGVAARAELAAYTATWLDDPPGQGVVAWVAARVDEVAIDRQVLANTLRALLHAGYESAGRFLGNAMLALLETPGALRSMREGDRGLALDELVRHCGPVQADARACVEAAEIGGESMRPGQSITLLLGAANRDPARFDHPDELRLDRDPNPHLGFGRGAHSCVGARLARLLAGAVFATLAAHYPDAELVAKPVHRPNATLRGLERLDVSLGAA